MSNTQPSTSGKTYVNTRVFDAPRDLVFRCWTEQARLAQWFSPPGCSTVSEHHDPRPGGYSHYKMTTPDGKAMWGKWVYKEVVPPARLVFINMFSDAKGGVSRHPMSPTWPLEMLTVVTLTESVGKTTLRLEWSPINPSAEERKTFEDGFAGMDVGWGGTLDALVKYLATQAKR